MTKHKHLLNIDKLREFNVQPAYFGLGFLQLKITANSRVHFYHKSLPVISDEPHNHRYGFTSHILQGRFMQTLYNFRGREAGKYRMIYEDCKPGSSSVDAMAGDLTETFHASYGAGDYYRITPDVLHAVSAKDNAITYLERDAPVKDHAGVVRKIGANAVCPFSQPITRCWELIEDMLPKIDLDSNIDSCIMPGKKKNPGYHIMDIPKGKVGEPSKIIEEAYEILDAHQQGIKVMAQVEMSDLYGALDRYRENYHPDVSMADLEAMYTVTKRAFSNGKRK